ETDTATDTESRYKSRADSSSTPASTTPANRSSSMPKRSILLLALGSLLTLLLLATSAFASPVFVDNPSLAQFQSGRNIRHLPCIVRKSGRSGVCMFAIDCIKQNGTHLGTCIDRFYFGSCCALKEEASLFAPEINDNSIDQNTISHFAHESTTLRTTDSSNHQQQQHMASELLKNVTQSYLSSAKPVRTTTSSSSSSSSSSSTSTTMISSSSSSSSSSSTSASTTRRPANAHTTHKNSHFVVRTTQKPSAAATQITTLKPLRRRTTTQRPVLTTLPALEQRIETTTVPSKFVTFQIVETTTPEVTEATNRWPETTTRRHSSRPTASSSSAAAKTTSRTTSTTTTAAPATTTSTTTTTTSTARPTPPLRTTTTAKPHKTQSSRRPVPPKKPATTTSHSHNATTTATRKPIETGSKLGNNTTTSHSPTKTTTTGSSSSSSSHKTTPATATRTTTKPERTTHAPRPKPQPTAEIVKVPALLADVPITTTTTTTKATRRPTTSSTATTTAPKKPAISSTTTTTTPKPTRRHTTKPTTTSTSSTTAAPTTTTTTTRRTTTTTTTAATTLTTEATKLQSPATATATATSSGGSSTKKPGLITWTDVEAEPITNATIASNWQPGQPADWIPMPTLLPESYNKTTAGAGAGNSTDKVVISVATSVSTSSESKPGQSQTPLPATTATTASKPHRTTKPPATTSKPATVTATAASSTTAATATATTTTPRTTTTTTTTATVTSKTTAATATESSIELASSTTSSTESSNELGSSTSTSSSSSTTDYSGEELNTTTIDAVGNTTVAPASGLEGVDYREVCGRRMFPEPRIVGGANAAFGRWPWQISLRQWRTSTYLHKCGAALLNENWAITAAHCVDNVPPSDLLLRLGEYDLAEEEEPYGFQERRVQIVASHPQFDPRTFEYDLALLRFYEPVVFQPNIIPVCVPDNDENFIGQTAFVTGWGRLYEDGPLPSVLQEVAVPVINNTICESMYRSAGYIEHIPHIFICAGWKKGGYDSCEGDSGGPMVLQRESDKRFQLGGVISWGIGCAEANQPGVYTRISEFRDWINQILQF
ncbi:hypothetical protein KR093_000640, partial [Drosophila rubida]